MHMCVRDMDFASVSTTFQLDFGTVCVELFVWNCLCGTVCVEFLFFILLLTSINNDITFGWSFSNLTSILSSIISCQILDYNFVHLSLSCHFQTTVNKKTKLYMYLNIRIHGSNDNNL